MGHLPIVNLATISGLIIDGYIGTTGTLKTLWVKTIADIFSDILATRPNDLIFPWIIANGEDRLLNQGFKHIFKIAANPIYIAQNDYPIKVEILDDFTEFPTPLSEPEALELWTRELLWNAIGKKSLGRGRSLTHQMPMEDIKLNQLLNLKNNLTPPIPKRVSNKITFTGFQNVTINTLQNTPNVRFNNFIVNLPEEDRIKNLDISKIQWVSGNVFRYEKVLEAWLMENIDKPSTNQLLELIGLSAYNLVWFGNYLPYGVAGSNIDAVLIHSRNDEIVVTVIELKVGAANALEYTLFSKQVTDYGLFLERAFQSYGKTVTVKNVLLTGPSSPSISVAFNGVRWITYSIGSNGVVSFTRKA